MGLCRVFCGSGSLKVLSDGITRRGIWVDRRDFCDHVSGFLEGFVGRKKFCRGSKITNQKCEKLCN